MKDRGTVGSSARSRSRIAPVTCGEYLDFMRDRGYERPELWLSDGWRACQQQAWSAPLYWERRGGEWALYTLSGMRPVDERARR